MAENVSITPGSGVTIAAKEIGGIHYQVVLPFPSIRISQTPTVSTSPAYTAKDAVGGLLTFANAAAEAGEGIVVDQVIVIDKAAQGPVLELVLFDRTFTPTSDNAAFDPSDGDLANCLGIISINAWSVFTDNAVAVVSGVGLAAILNGTDLFGQLMVRSTPTFASTSDITVIVVCRRI